LSLLSVSVGEIALFDKALVLVLACVALAMCAMWVGFILRGEEKNKINFSKFALNIYTTKFFFYTYIQRGVL